MGDTTKIISIMNLPGNGYTLFTFLNVMYSAGVASKSSGKKCLFLDLDLSKAQFSRSFKTVNMSKLLKAIDKYKENFVFDKEEIKSNVVSAPMLNSGVVMENVDAFLITGNIARVTEFMKFDIQFVKAIIDLFKEEYDYIYIFTSQDKESKLDKHIFKISDMIISSIASPENVFENTLAVVETNKVTEKGFRMFYYIFPEKVKTFFESLKDKLTQPKKENSDEFLEKLAYFLFKKKFTDEEKAKMFIHTKVNEKIIEAEMKKDTIFNKTTYLNVEERNTYLKYIIEFIGHMF